MMMHLYTLKKKFKTYSNSNNTLEDVSEYPQCPTPIYQFRSQNYTYTLKIKPVYGKLIPGQVTVSGIKSLQSLDNTHQKSLHPFYLFPMDTLLANELQIMLYTLILKTQQNKIHCLVIFHIRGTEHSHLRMER